MRAFFYNDATCRVLVFDFPLQLRDTPRPYIFRVIYNILCFFCFCCFLCFLKTRKRITPAIYLRSRLPHFLS